MPRWRPSKPVKTIFEYKCYMDSITTSVVVIGENPAIPGLPICPRCGQQMLMVDAGDIIPVRRL